MADAREHDRTDEELEAREQLMHEQFERDADAWEEATPLDQVLQKLKSVSTKK